MQTNLKIAIDVMGSDNGPEAIISGASLSKERHPKIEYLFFGDEELIKSHLKNYKNLNNSYEIIHAQKVVLPEDKPSLALRKRGNTSALVSAGNTGALMAMAKLQLRMLEGISRPAIAATFPHEKGEFILLDLGANTDCNTENLMQFAIMGTEFAKVVLGRDDPKIAILNIGTEQDKGKLYINDAANLLMKSYLSKNFIGYIEGSDMTKGLADVVVADGFSGNIALKTAEGVAVLCSSYIKKIFQSSILGKISYLFLGLNGLVVKSHGSADSLGFEAAIDIAYEFAQEEVGIKITKSLSKIQYKM